MPSKNSTNSLILITMLVLCTTASSYASFTNAGNWKNFGNRILYFLGSGGCPMPVWLQRQQQVIDAFAKPDLRESVLAVELYLEEALKGYEPNSFAWHGRVDLDINPRCIFGLYLVDKFPGTKLMDAGKRQFERSIEHSCLVALGTGSHWQQLFETELTKTYKDSTDGFQPEFFDEAEVPFLLIYLIENGSSEDIRQRAREQLARYLWERYGLEPALRQYCILLKQGYTNIGESTKLEVAKQLKQTGAISDAQQFYEKILQDTDSSETAKEAAENLARIKQANSQQRYAWKILDVLHKRFPDAQLADEDLEMFFSNFQANREERSKKLLSEHLTSQEQEKVLRLCRLYNGLWTEEEALNRWQSVVDNTEPGSPFWQIARLYLAESLVSTGNVGDAKDMLDDLSGSSYPIIQARALLALADIAQAIERASEAVALYQQAAQIERPTVSPEWFKSFQIKPLDVKNLAAEELSFFASFLRGYNELIDGSFESAVVNLLKAKEIACKTRRDSLLSNANKTIPAMLMLAYVKIGDYARAEEYGLQAVRNLKEQGEENKQSSTSLSQIERVDNVLFALFRELRTLQQPDLKSQPERYARNVYTAVTRQGALDTGPQSAGRGLMSIFWQIKKQRMARLLFAEYSLAEARLRRSSSFKEFLNLEPIMFTTQLLDKDSFEQISNALAATTPQEYAKGQMYRFAKFAQRLNRPYMARMALNVAAEQISSARGNVQLLKNIADMYLKGNSHQKAIEIYERIVQQVPDTSEAEKAQLEIIKVYAEQLRLYDKAVQECQRFLKKFSDSQQVSEVEFLIGKLAYLDKDYAGAVGQLHSFQRKYPNSPQAGEAMMLAALSRMSEGNIQDAIDRFTEIIQKYPEGDLAARSKFLIGYAQVSGQKYSNALETFKQLVEQFPQSRYVKQAQSLIDRLSKVSQ